jgi:uncharacterized protein YjbJ (UPF0337 family)
VYGGERKKRFAKRRIPATMERISTAETDMNRDRLEGMWKQFSGKAREQWCLLTGDAPGMVAARRDQRIGWNQEGRGIANEAVADQMKEFLARNRDWDLTNR